MPPDEIEIPAPTTEPTLEIPSDSVKISVNDALALIRSEVENFLATTAQNAKASAEQLDRFVEILQPDVEAAILEQDLMSLNYLRDRVAMHLGRASLGLIWKEREAVAQTVVTVLRVVIKIAIGALTVA